MSDAYVKVSKIWGVFRIWFYDSVNDDNLFMLIRREDEDQLLEFFKCIEGVLELQTIEIDNNKEKIKIIMSKGTLQFKIVSGMFRGSKAAVCQQSFLEHLEVKHDSPIQAIYTRVKEKGHG